YAPAWSLTLKTVIALCAFIYVLPFSAGAQECRLNPFCRFTACTPVAYLFRHAEEAGNPTNLRDNTLTAAGNRHPALYTPMIRRFEAAFGYCPVNRVFAMARKNAPSALQYPNGLGTTNPFFTGRPFSVAVRREYDVSVSKANGGVSFPEEDPYY